MTDEEMEICQRAWEAAGRRADILFGDKEDSELSDQELEIIFSDLPFNTKVAKLTVIRGETAIKPKTFKQRLNKADEIHARAMGIKL